MKKKKEEKKKKASQARPAPTSPTGQPSPSHLLSASPRARSSRPAPTHAQQPSSWPSASPARPAAFASCRCHLTPCVSRTSPTPTRLPASACSRCPLDPACQPYCSSSPRRAQPPRDQTPTALAGGGPGGHAQGMPLSPLRHAHATMRVPLDASVRLRSPLGLHPPITELHGRARL